MKWVLSLVVLLFVAGCAGQPERGTDRISNRASAEDSRYVSAVEQGASRRNMEVIWLHPPKKRSTAKDDAAEDDG